MTSHRSWSRSVALLLLAVPFVASAQGNRSRLEGTVTALASGRPLGGVMIAVPAARAFAISDSAGRFTLAALPAGRTVVRVIQDDSTITHEYVFALNAGETKRIDVVVDAEAVELEPIVVQADWAVNRWGMAGFHARRRLGFGRFITREDIARRGALRLLDAITGSGVFVGCGRDGCGPMTVTRGGRCLLGVRIDGMPVFPEQLESIALDDVGGIEIYRNDTFTPYEFRNGGWLAGYRLGGGLGRCGTVVVWTRGWRSDLPADW